MSEYASERTETLNRLEGWYKKDGNALHVWEAIARCCRLDPPGTPLPEFCRVYLRDAATNMTQLAWGRDFRADKKVISTKKAMPLVGQALGLVRPKSKNAFLRLEESADAMGAALRGDSGIKDLEQDRSISEDRAKRISKKGSNLLNLKLSES